MVRLPRHGASLPIGNRRILLGRPAGVGQDHPRRVYIEELEHNPARFLPDIDEEALGGDVVHIDLSQPMPAILAALSKHRSGPG